MGRKDIRVIKTQRALATAMLTLLEKQDFQSITVNDLCAEARVSRSTFYLHFEDKYALLHFCAELMNQRLQGDEPAATLEGQLKDLLERIKANVRLVKNLMMVNLDVELYEMLRKSLHSAVEQALAEQEQTVELPGPLDVITSFYTSGLTATIMYWIKNNMPYSTDEMARCLAALLPV